MMTGESLSALILQIRLMFTYWTLSMVTLCYLLKDLSWSSFMFGMVLAYYFVMILMVFAFFFGSSASCSNGKTFGKG
jgi:hypothetical protein